MTDPADQPRQRRAWILVGPTAAGKTAVSNELDALSQDLVERGLAVWSGGKDEDTPARLIVRGRANLLEGLAGAEALQVQGDPHAPGGGGAEIAVQTHRFAFRRVSGPEG